MIRIVLFGPYPPPSGGNSVHVKRLGRALLDKGYSCQVVDPYGSSEVFEEDELQVTRVGGNALFSIIRSILKIGKFNPDVVHIHVSALQRFLYVGPVLLSHFRLFSRVFLTIHSGSFVASFRGYSRLKKHLTILFLRKFDGIIAVNLEQKEVLVSFGLEAAKVRVLPAYLPPMAVPTSELKSIIGNASRNKKGIIVSSGYGLPLYGHEKIIDAFIQDKRLAKDFTILICLYNTFDEDYVNKLEHSLSSLRGSLILMNLSPTEFAYVLQNAAMYVRATDRDGDAVAIREAHYYGVPVVASSVVVRPEFCFTFDRNDTASLVHSIWSGLKTSKAPKQNNDGIVDKIVEFYSLGR